MNGSPNESHENLSDFGGVVMTKNQEDEEDEDINTINIMDDKEYLQRTFKMCPKFAENHNDMDNTIYSDEIQGHVLGALMATSALIEDGGVSAASIDQNLTDITHNFVTLKRIATILEDSDAARKNNEVALRNPIFHGIIEEVKTAEGARFRPVENSRIGELVNELKRCFKKNRAEQETKASKKKREMELPENKIRYMHARNLLVHLVNLTRKALEREKVKWQEVQKFYVCIREADHEYHEVLYQENVERLKLDEYPTLDAKANKYLFGRSKTTNFLSSAMFNDVIQYVMIENQLYVYFDKPVTEENYDQFIFGDEDFEAVLKLHDEFLAQMEDRREFSNRNFNRDRKKRADPAQPKFREATLPTAAVTYAERLAQRNVEEDVYFDSNNLDCPFGVEPVKSVEKTFSSDEDDILSVKCFSDEDEETRKEKDEKKRIRQEAIAAKEERKQQMREQQKNQSQGFSAGVVERKSSSLEKSPTAVAESVENGQSSAKLVSQNRWEKSISEAPESPVKELPRPKVTTYSHTNPTVQPLFGIGNNNDNHQYKRAENSCRATQEKSLFGGPSESITSVSSGRMNTSVTNQFEQINISKPVNSSKSHKPTSCSSSLMDVVSDSRGLSFSPTLTAPYNPSPVQSYPLERLSSSCSVASTVRDSGRLEEKKAAFLTFLKSHVSVFRSEKCRHMRTMPNIALSHFGHPSRLFGSKYMEIIQDAIPQVQVEDVEIEDGYEIVFNWVG